MLYSNHRKLDMLMKSLQDALKKKKRKITRKNFEGSFSVLSQLKSLGIIRFFSISVDRVMIFLDVIYDENYLAYVNSIPDNVFKNTPFIFKLLGYPDGRFFIVQLIGEAFWVFGYLWTDTHMYVFWGFQEMWTLDFKEQLKP